MVPQLLGYSQLGNCKMLTLHGKQYKRAAMAKPESLKCQVESLRATI